MHAHRYTYVCMHTDRGREKERERNKATWQGVKSLKLHKDVQASIISYQILVGLIFSILAYCPYN